MKTKLICTGIVAMAASFGAAAQETSRNVTDPTASCIGALAGEPRLKLIADKVAPGQGIRVPERAVTAEERAAVATLVSMRKGCFDAGTPYRRVVSTPQEFTVTHNAFAYQQGLLTDLQEGRITYAEFNRRRLKLVDVTKL